MRPGPVADPTAIGQVSSPPFAIPPNVAELFARRADRLRTYAGVSPMRPYLEFLAAVADAQASTARDLGPAAPLDEVKVLRSPRYAMPPIDRADIRDDPDLLRTLDALFERLSLVGMPEEAAEALATLRAADDEDLDRHVRSALAQEAPAHALAEHAYVAAGVQVHLARVAASLDADKLVPVGDGVCPACGGAPVASLVVDRPSAHGIRYCVCASCGTQWHYVRIRCCSCGTTKGIGYQEVKGAGGLVKAETCDGCRTYVKVMYENLDATIEPVADDVGTLALDLLMRDGPYRRAAANPFLASF